MMRCRAWVRVAGPRHQQMKWIAARNPPVLRQSTYFNPAFSNISRI